MSFNFGGETLREYNFLGTIVTISIEEAQLIKGIYFYALVVNKQEMIAKKMIVN